MEFVKKHVKLITLGLLLCLIVAAAAIIMVHLISQSNSRTAIASNDKITVNSSVVKDGVLSIKLSSVSKIQKVKVYSGDNYIETLAPSNPTSFTVSVGGIDETKLTNDITLQLYKDNINFTEKQIRVMNDSNVGVNNQTFEIDQCNYTALKAKTTPVVDGLENDACWAKAEWKDLKYVWGAAQPLPLPSDCSGRYKLTWTNDKLYLLAEITDDVLSDTHPNPLDNYWNDDALEVFIDEDHSGGDHTHNYNAFAYHVALDNNVVDLLKADTDTPGLFNNSIKCVRKDSGSLHVWEMAINIYSDKYDDKSANNTPVELTANKVMGFALAYDDSDQSTRKNFIGSIPVPSGQDYGWRNADVFEKLTLAE